MTTKVHSRAGYGDAVEGTYVHGEEVISLEDLMELAEYSCSIPTGTTIGKRWRRATRYHAPAITEWWIGTYVEHPEPHRVGIEWVWAVSEPGRPHRTER